MNKPDSRPNVLVVLADDLGFSDLGCYGGEIDTPNLDRLAREGLRFSHFYNTPKCSPSRASLLTGLHPHQVGMGILAHSGMDFVPEPPDGYVGNLSRDCVTLAEILKANGYRTFLSGKWHLSNNLSKEDDTWPRARGFDHHYGNVNGATSYFYPVTVYRDGVNVEQEAVENPDFYYTDAISDQAVTYLREHIKGPDRDMPFFLYLAYTCPHWPIHAKTTDIEKYKGRFDEGWDVLRQRRMKYLRDTGLLDKKWEMAPREIVTPPWDELEEEDRPWFLRRMEVYAAMVDCMDQGIGRVISLLEEQGILDNTIVIFLSDNGASPEEIGNSAPAWIPQGVARSECRDGSPVYHGTSEAMMPGPENTFMSVGRDWAHLSTTPFRGFKDWTHEGGISTPFILRYPGAKNETGGIRHDPAQLTDIMPTILEFAGIEYPKQYEGRDIQPCEGKSLVSCIARSEPLEKENMYWEHLNSAAIRDGNWKLVRFKKQRWELYDMEADRTELSDLADTNAELKEELVKKYEAWAKRCNVLLTEEVWALRTKYMPKDWMG